MAHINVLGWTALDWISLVAAIVIGVPQAVIAARKDRPANLRRLALFLGLAALFAGGAAVAHRFNDGAAARAALLGCAAMASIGWVICLLDLARHNTTM